MRIPCEYGADFASNHRYAGYDNLIYVQALVRADMFNIPGVTLQHTQGVVKNIIPAIPSTNAIVAAACVLETLKMATMCSTGMSNYTMYVDVAGQCI